MTIHAMNAESSKFQVPSSKLDSKRSALNLEPAALGSAKRLGGRDTPELREAFNDFVGQTFFGELLKQMRETVHKSEFFHGGMGEEVFQTQLDQIMVERMTETSAQTFSDPMYELLMARRS